MSRFESKFPVFLSEVKNYPPRFFSVTLLLKKVPTLPHNDDKNDSDVQGKNKERCLNEYLKVTIVYPNSKIRIENRYTETYIVHGNSGLKNLVSTFLRTTGE